MLRYDSFTHTWLRVFKIINGDRILSKYPSASIEIIIN